MTSSFGLAFILLVVGVLIVFIELFIPSAGLLFIASSVCILGSLYFAFQVGVGTGFLFVVTIFGLILILPRLLIRIWRNTPIGKRMFLESPSDDAEEDSDEGIDERYDSLEGAIGRTLTPLRPSGMTELLGQRIDTVTEGVMIEQGEYVRVIAVEGNRVKVRKLTATELKDFTPDLD
ncbi:hypothetical protein Pan216_06080 [Planctomycetes bacterium Pan216]|uniref:NfeD-like C-terminal domain-containing protein n=1 Tax=Kolteria novifilia TaxID=2527975 RepID=A0A518AYH4_9BACT|nr:hypothetical protein Pan216_06080 [Planctomycetes bacterium Pan216]